VCPCYFCYCVVLSVLYVEHHCQNNSSSFNSTHNTEQHLCKIIHLCTNFVLFRRQLLTLGSQFCGCSMSSFVGFFYTLASIIFYSSSFRLPLSFCFCLFFVQYLNFDCSFVSLYYYSNFHCCFVSFSFLCSTFEPSSFVSLFSVRSSNCRVPFISFSFLFLVFGYPFYIHLSFGNISLFPTLM